VKTNKISAGDRVRFCSRGRRIDGTVTRVRVRHRRRRSFFPALDSCWVAEVIPDNDASVWTVPFSHLKRTGTASTRRRNKAHDTGWQVRSAIKKNQHERRAENRKRADENGLLSGLCPGDKVIVHYCDIGSREETFMSFSGSNRVGIMSHNRPGKVRYVSPHNVSLPEKRRARRRS